MKEVRVCKCGRIHIIPEELYEKALETDKNLLLICGHCGASTLFGADKEEDVYGLSETGVCYNLYAIDYSTGSNAVITEEQFMESDTTKALSAVYYSQGIKVPMKTGEYASSYNHYSGFVDEIAPYFEFQLRNGTDMRAYVETYVQTRKVVDMERFIAENDENVLKEVSARGIAGLNWEGTAYDSSR